MSTHHFRSDIYRYVYAAFTVLFIVALAVLAGMRGYLPYGVSFVSGGESLFTSFLVVRPVSMEPTLGAVVGRHGEVGYAVQPYILMETRRSNGALQYVVQPIGSESHTTATLMAREFGSQVVLSIPMLGAVVRALAHPIGLMGLFGVPLVMFFLHFLLMVRTSPVLKRIRLLSVRAHARREAVATVRDEEVAQVGDAADRRYGYRGVLSFLTRKSNDTKEVQETEHTPVINSGMTVELKKWGNRGVADIISTTSRSHQYSV